MNLHSDDISKWTDSLGDFSPEYVSVRVWNAIQLYRLMGRKTVILLDNFEPIPDLHYSVFSAADKRYYLHIYPDIPLWLILFYKTDRDWDSYDAFVNSIRRYIEDGNIYLLLTTEQVSDTSNALRRLWNANLEGDGKLDYKIYLKIAETTLRYEDYKDHGKSLTGFKTVCKQFEDQIAELWKQAYSLKR